MRDGGSLIFNSSVVGLYLRRRDRRLRDVQARGRRADAHRREEVAGRGIRVNSIHPGPVDNAFQHSIEVTATGAPRRAPPSSSRS